MATILDRLSQSDGQQRLLRQERAILEITETLCKLMEEQNITRADLARKLGTSKANITQMLDGQRNLTVRTIADVLYHLGHALRLTPVPMSRKRLLPMRIRWQPQQATLSADWSGVQRASVRCAARRGRTNTVSGNALRMTA
ncbi:MAG: helix-turn-helix domain-containing protein [Phycisphaerae bacterium]